MVQEAGGQVSDMHGQPASLTGRTVLADNGLIHGGILGLFGEVFSGQARVKLPEAGPEQS